MNKMISRRSHVVILSARWVDLTRLHLPQRFGEVRYANQNKSVEEKKNIDINASCGILGVRRKKGRVRRVNI